MENIAYVTLDEKKFWETQTLAFDTTLIKPEQMEIRDAVLSQVASLNKKLDKGYDTWFAEMTGEKISDADKKKLVNQLQTVITELNEKIGKMCAEHEMTTEQEKWEIQATIGGAFSGKSLFIEESKTASLMDVIEQKGTGVQTGQRAVLSLQ